MRCLVPSLGQRRGSECGSQEAGGGRACRGAVWCEVSSFLGRRQVRALGAGSSGQCLWPRQLFTTRKPVSHLGLPQGWVTPFPEIAQPQVAGPPLFRPVWAFSPAGLVLLAAGPGRLCLQPRSQPVPAAACRQAPSVQPCLEGRPFHEGHRVGATPLLAPPQQGKGAHVDRRVGGSRGSCLELKSTLGQWRAWLAAWGLFTGLCMWSSQRLGQVPRREGPEPPQRHLVC